MTSRKAWDRTNRPNAYGRQHAKLRAQLLRSEPLCRLCLAKTPPRVTAAVIADHITPIANGGAIHDISNLQPVCHECHSEKTLRDQGKRVKRTIGIDGWPT